MYYSSILLLSPLMKKKKNGKNEHFGVHVLNTFSENLLYNYKGYRILPLQKEKMKIKLIILKLYKKKQY